MTANTDFDCKLKCGLIDDVLTIVDMEGIRSGQEMTVGGFDLIIDKDVKVHLYKRFEGKSTLGFRNEREKVIKKIVDDFIRRKICSKDANKENVGELVKKDNKPE